jgi:ethanolamine utilization cobalamin adenosyltransferase
MLFLTEDDVRARCPQPGSTLNLGPGERLTPSAAEYARSLRVTTLGGPGAAPAGSCGAPAPAPAGSASGSCAMTWLNADTQVPKTCGSIIFRGKMDSLLASAMLVQTQFDPKERLPALLKDCLRDVKNWIMQVLAAEMSGKAPEIAGMAGMDMDTLHTVSRDPVKYLGMDHCMAHESQGGNVALINWLRALVRETEIAALRNLPGESPVCCALNRLSSALYVLMLLTMAAQAGKDLSQFRG